MRSGEKEHEKESKKRNWHIPAKDMKQQSRTLSPEYGKAGEDYSTTPLLTPAIHIEALH